MARKIGKSADDIYWIQEVIGNANEAPGIQPRNYLGTGTVTQFDYKSDLNAKFKGKIAGLKDLSMRIGELGHRPQRRRDHVQERFDVRARERVHARLRLRHAASALRL